METMIVVLELLILNVKSAIHSTIELYKQGHQANVDAILEPMMMEKTLLVLIAIILGYYFKFTIL